ncbi:Tropinone reductase-like 3 [Hibiscus syriacus]|uniref:Tropinone reductase-like 3 n=1 Tax=Hibiscus syriacus TaxID=106335 RepID=A0A6A2W8A2_HIBSY|nr:Tropinone reductase-like 3 [Hibiscus syriacus]
MYEVTKTALLGLTKALAAEMAPDVRLNCVAPSFIPTRFAAHVTGNEDAKKTYEEMKLLKRLGTVDEIAAATAFLASDDASYITGETLIVVAGGTSWPVVEGKEQSGSDNILACPICYDPLTRIGDSPLCVGSTSGSNLQCNTCKKAYFGNETHLDLVASSGSKQYESMPLATEVFRTPMVSFLYERGWRQNFIFGGFPGPEKEFDMAKDYLKPVLGGTIVDASCGSGMFSRLFAKGGLFSQESDLGPADIARLPFKSSSVDALHAGAALHCWSSPSTAVAEISRVLRPGGVFVATTYILDGPFAFVPFMRTFRQSIMGIAGGHIFLSDRELGDLCQTCGLVDFTCIRNARFVMISARKSS